MVAGSLLPITIHNNKLYFLFGKENPMEDSAKGWSDFGGRVDAGETPFTAALREGGEELTGFLGNNSALRKLVKKMVELSIWSITNTTFTCFICHTTRIFPNITIKITNFYGNEWIKIY